MPSRGTTMLLEDHPLFFKNGSQIRPISAGTYSLSEGGEILTFDEAGKPCFENKETGERVIEFSGMATDGRSDRSWARAIFAKGSSSPAHYHNERTELYYVIAGRASVMIDGAEHLLSPGEFVEILPRQEHQVFSVGEETLEIMVKCSPAWVFTDQHLVES